METECRAEIYKAWYHVLIQNFTYAKTLCSSVIKKFYQYRHFQDQFMLISLYFVVGQFALAMRDYDLEQQVRMHQITFWTLLFLHVNTVII